MKFLIALLPALLLTNAFAADPAPQTATKQPAEVHRYLVERTFPAGALEGLNADGKAKVNATNSKFGVNWVTSYANSAKTKTYCIYEGPNEAAIRKAAQANKMSVDAITEVPVTLTPR
jgi:hypothetical protein